MRELRAALRVLRRYILMKNALGAERSDCGTIGCRGQAQGARRQRNHPHGVAGHVEELDRVAVLAYPSDGMALYDRANVAGAQAALRDIASQDHVAVHFEGHVLPRVDGNKSRHIGASVNLPDGTKLDTAAVGRPDRSHNFIHDAVLGVVNALICASTRPAAEPTGIDDTSARHVFGTYAMVGKASSSRTRTSRATPNAHGLRAIGPRRKRPRLSRFLYAWAILDVTNVWDSSEIRQSSSRRGRTFHLFRVSSRFKVCARGTALGADKGPFSEDRRSA